MEEEALGLLPPAMANAMGDAITGAKTYAHPCDVTNVDFPPRTPRDSYGYRYCLSGYPR